MIIEIVHIFAYNISNPSAAELLNVEKRLKKYRLSLMFELQHFDPRLRNDQNYKYHLLYVNFENMYGT